MSWLLRNVRSRDVRRCLRFEQFEPRQLLSLAAIATDPAPGATVGAAPPALTVTFNEPIDPTSLSPADIGLDQVDDEGNLQPVAGVAEYPGVGDDQLTLALPPDLPPGHYQIVLAAGSGLMSVDGDVLDPAAVDAALGDFWVVARGVGLADAVDLGTLGSAPLGVTGTLDFQSNPGDVRLYRFTLPAGHTWRLGAEVSAERDGGTLDSALALFDSRGRLITADDLGRQDAPYDPYLFAGLRPGTYYIGVSGTGNIPGTPAGYDPAASTAGTVAQAQPGGPFRLVMVADPDVAPVVLRSLTPDYADPSDSTPTGFTLSFSGAIRTGGTVGTLGDAFGHAIEVVDQAGHIWPVIASNYSEAQARISFLFRSAPTPGLYTVRLRTGGGLTDLAGRTPVAAGQAAGVLGAFGVSLKRASLSRRDLGALLPDAALGGITVENTLRPGESVSYRLVITFPSMYTFQTSFGGGGLDLEVSGPSGTVARDRGPIGTVSGTNDTMLVPGVYEIRVTAVGDRTGVAKLVIASPSVSLESILTNGIGQGPGLSLRLIAPPSIVLPPPSPDGPGGGSGDSPGGHPPTPAGQGQGSVTLRLATSRPSPGPPLYVALEPVVGGEPIGRPLLDWAVFARAAGQVRLPGSLPDIARVQAARVFPEWTRQGHPGDQDAAETLPSRSGDVGAVGGSRDGRTGDGSTRPVLPEGLGPDEDASASLAPAPNQPPVPRRDAANPLGGLPDDEAASLPDSYWPVALGLALAVLVRPLHALRRRWPWRGESPSLRASSPVVPG